MIDLDLPEDDELERDLILLAQQQEKLLAELALAYEEESEREREEMESGRRAAFDQEMEARVKAMNLSVSPEEIEDAFEEVREVKEISNEVSNMFETYLERFSFLHFYILCGCLVHTSMLTYVVKKVLLQLLPLKALGKFLIFLLLVTITKFSIVIGSPCAYWSRNRRAIS